MAMTSIMPLLSVSLQSLGAMLFVFVIASAMSHRDLGKTLFFSTLLSTPIVALIAIRGLAGILIGLVYCLLFLLAMQFVVFGFLYVRRVYRYHRFPHKVAGNNPELQSLARRKSVDLERIFQEIYQDLLPAAQVLSGIAAQELPESKVEIVEPDRKNPFPNADIDHNSCVITVNASMAIFLWHMSKIIASRVVDVKDDNAPLFSFGQSINNVKVLVDAYCTNSLEEPIIPAIQLPIDQLAFAGWMVTTIERFIVAHELGHFLGRIAPNSVAPVTLPARDIATNAYGAFTIKNDIGGTDKEVVDNWDSELSADIIGMHLCLNTRLKDEDDEHDLSQINNTYTQLSVPIYFKCQHLIETFFKEKYNQQLPYDSHPPALVRYDSVRRITILEDVMPQGLSVDDSLVAVDQIFDRVLQEV